MDLNQELADFGKLMELIDNRAAIAPLNERLQKVLDQLIENLKQKKDQFTIKNEEQWLTVFASLPLKNLLIILEQFEINLPGSNAKFFKTAQNLTNNDVIYHNFVKRLTTYSRLKAIVKIFELNRLETIYSILTNNLKKENV